MCFALSMRVVSPSIHLDSTPMHASISDSPLSGGPGPDAQWAVVDAAVAQVLEGGASEVDQGLVQLLQALLAATPARCVSCSLTDRSEGRGPTRLFTESVGLCAVDGGLHPGAGPVIMEWEVRSGRWLTLEWVLARPDAVIPAASVLARLQALRRWLIWLDLSRGPVTAKGAMPAHHRKVLLALLDGLSEKQVAAELGLSINTAHQYVTALYRRFNVRNRASLMGLWLASA